MARWAYDAQQQAAGNDNSTPHRVCFSASMLMLSPLGRKMEMERYRESVSMALCKGDTQACVCCPFGPPCQIRNTEGVGMALCKEEGDTQACRHFTMLAALPRAQCKEAAEGSSTEPEQGVHSKGVTSARAPISCKHRSVTCVRACAQSHVSASIVFSQLDHSCESLCSITCESSNHL
eukprot:1158670-Pelagomonas_calceolata.AAC.4